MFDAKTIELFWNKVDIRGKDECWEWLGPRRKNRLDCYFLTPEKRFCIAPRVAYELTFGGLGKYIKVTHKCGHLTCCNPDHLAKPDDQVSSRFWAKVKIGAVDECWEWQGFRGNGGYGKFSVGTGNTAYAHRVSYELSKGSIPKGLHVCHKCDNPPCVNPNHFFLGTVQDNIRDRDNKGRTNSGKRSKVSFANFSGGNSWKAKLTWDQVNEIRRLHSAKIYRDNKLAKMFNCSQGTIYKIVTYQTWKIY